MLHKYVIFVGDKPSSKNISRTIPFVGTRSYHTLLSWIAHMNVDFRLCDMINIKDYDKRSALTKYIALGENASNFLHAKGVPHYKMPHPSGLNRKLNNPTFIKTELQKCKEYIFA